MKLRKLIHRMTEDACMEPFLTSSRRKGAPGERISRLSQEERALLKTCTSKDFNDVREEFIRFFLDDSHVTGFTRKEKLELEKKFNRRKMAL